MGAIDRADQHEQQQNERLGAVEVAPSEKSQTGDGTEIDLNLVCQLREMLRKEFETSKEKSKYSQQHYDEIMDASSPHTCWRYLLHCHNDLKAAFELILVVLVWRKENAVDTTKGQDLVKEFWHYSPVTFTGPSKDESYDVLYILGRNYRKPDSILKPEVRKFCLYLLSKWDQRHRYSLRKFCIVFDVSQTGYRNIDLDYMAWLVSIRDYFPARIHQVYVIGIPMLVRPLVRLVISWLPEHFRRLVSCGTFEQLIEPNIDLDKLPAEAGGGLTDESYRLAPPESPWLADSSIFSDPAMQNALEDSIAFKIDTKRREQLRALQVDYENGQVKN